MILTILCVSIIFFGLFGFVWIKGGIGGADLKLIPFLMIFSSINSKNIIVSSWFFLVILIILSIIYFILAKFTLKNKRVPFLPIFTLTYLILELFKIYIK